MVRAARKSPRRLLLFSTVSAVLLMALMSMGLQAQDSTRETCPCFNYEEVESIFLSGVNMTDDEGMVECSAQDYKAECSAKVTITDQDYNVVASASLDWYDYDPGGCEYLDTKNDPDVERNARWPHPAPEATARACFNIISNVIKKSDTSGNCNTYP